MRRGQAPALRRCNRVVPYRRAGACPRRIPSFETHPPTPKRNHVIATPTLTFTPSGGFGTRPYENRYHAIMLRVSFTMFRPRGRLIAARAPIFQNTPTHAKMEPPDCPAVVRRSGGHHLIAPIGKELRLWEVNDSPRPHAVGRIGHLFVGADGLAFGSVGDGRPPPAGIAPIGPALDLHALGRV